MGEISWVPIADDWYVALTPDGVVYVRHVAVNGDESIIPVTMIWDAITNEIVGGVTVKP